MMHSTLRTFAAAFLAAALAAPAPADVIVLRAPTIHVGDGRVIENGMVIIEEGRIVAVGTDLTVPEGADVLEIEHGSITPGLIDANALLEPDDLIEVEQPGRRRRNVLEQILNPRDKPLAHLCDGSPVCPLCPIVDDERDAAATAAASGEPAADPDVCPVCGGVHSDEGQYVSGVRPGVSHTEGSSEVVPHTSVIDSVNLRSRDFHRLLAGGVTTVFASSDSAAVIGPRGAIVRTGGSMKERVLVEQADVKASMGSDTFRVGGGNRTPFRTNVSSRTRRPNSRMGVAWVFRKAFYDAEKHAQGIPVTGADQPPADAMEALQAIRAGSVPLRVQARGVRDISTAMRLADEFGLAFTLLEATEAYKCVDEIAARGMSVVFGPIYSDPTGVRAFSDETRESRLSTVRTLLDAGVPTALSAQDLREEDGLARQAMYAMRSGVDAEAALTAVTLTPAKLIGVADEIGSIETGKRGDLVVWSDAPFAATSRPVLVLIDGEIVLDRRNG